MEEWGCFLVWACLILEMVVIGGDPSLAGGCGSNAEDVARRRAS